MKTHSVFTSSAPAKLILSGEHSVVYGAPALGMALNLYANTRLSFTENHTILFKLKNFNTEISYDISTLNELKEKIDQRYSNFLRNNLAVEGVLKPTELLPYTFALYTTQYEITSSGICVDITSDIPAGLGLGSSASCIVSLLRALSLAFSPIRPDENFIRLAQQIENLVHGKSSGFDIKLVFHKCFLYCQQETCTVYPSPNFPFKLINTGIPSVGTAQCVIKAAEAFKADKMLLTHFAQVTQSLFGAIKKQNLTKIKQYIKKNHYLLCDIGVVPAKVQQCIADIEKRGNAAKICGAGASQGDAAGIILIVGEHPVSDILSYYNYEALEMHSYRGLSHESPCL